MQSDLFTWCHSDPLLLPMEDAKVHYYHDFFQIDEANRYFVELKNTLCWSQDEISLFGRRVKIPRLQAWHGDPEAIYRYSKLVMQPKPWTETLRAIKFKIEQQSANKFNSVLANYYRNGQDSMGWHSDDEPELGRQPVIASVSFGATRDFDFRHKRSKQKHRIALTHGSLLIMQGNTQHNWQHGIAKRRADLAGRISLTFRQVKFPTDTL